MNPITPIQLTEAEDLLRQWIGLDPSTLGHAAISRAVLTRMTKLGVDNAETYLADATANAAERNNLIEEIVVPESWFFRDPQVYAFLKNFASERAAMPGRSPVRILSAPCAAGQEPYSIAMCLLDAGMSPSDMAIDAIEISHVCLGKAGAAEYSANAFRTADLSFRDRWFTRHDGGFALQGSVRRCVRFNWANVLDESLVTDAFASGRAPYDIIFCRNLLIYLTPAARSRVEQAINTMLQPDGVVVVGAAESPILKGDWVPASDNTVFVLRHGGRDTTAHPAQKTRPLLRPGLLNEPSPDARHGVLPPARAPTTRTATAVVAAPQPAVEPDSAVPSDATLEPGPEQDERPSPVTDVIRQANALANARQFAAALTMCETYQNRNPPSSELFLLMGMIHLSAGDVAKAQANFHKTLYLDPQNEEALLSLSILSAHGGDMAWADHYRQAAARVFARKGAQ